MKKLMFALAAVAPLFISADSNTVSRAEFEALLSRVKAIEDENVVLKYFVSRPKTFPSIPRLEWTTNGLYCVVWNGYVKDEHWRRPSDVRKVFKRIPISEAASLISTNIEAITKVPVTTNAPTLLRK